MQDRDGLGIWIGTIMERLPMLSKPQAVVLALWSFDMVVTRSCGLTTVSAFLATALGQKDATVRQRLREWYRDKEHKKGEKRRDLDVSICFPALIGWVLSWWLATEHRIALAIDATTLADRLVVLAISIVYRGCAIPVAWKVLLANEKGAWKPHWLALFEQVKGSIPSDWFVLVTADRGLYARWLFKAIKKNGWHPFLRINRGGKYRPEGHNAYRRLCEIVTEPGQSWGGAVTCFKTRPIECTLLGHWDEG